VLVLAGDIDLVAALRLAQQHFGAWKKPAADAPVVSGLVGSTWADGVVVVDMPGTGQAGVVVTMPRSPPLARTHDRLGDQRGAGRGLFVAPQPGDPHQARLSYGARSGFDARTRGRCIAGRRADQEPSAAEVLGLIGTELDRLASTPGAAEGAGRTRRTLIGDFSRTLETSSGLAAQTARWSPPDSRRPSCRSAWHASTPSARPRCRPLRRSTSCKPSARRDRRCGERVRSRTQGGRAAVAGVEADRLDLDSQDALKH